MRGARPLAVVLILSMLSACAGRAPHPQVADTPVGPASETYADAVETITERENERRMAAAGHNVAPVAHRGGRDRHLHPRGHHHHEPSPEAQAAAEATLLLMGSAFLCTFVVVVLDGACSFGAHAGYYY